VRFIMNKGKLTHNNGVNKAYLSVAETAMYTGISEGTIRKFLKDPTNPLPHYRVGTAGRIIRINKHEIDQWFYFYKAKEEDKYLDSIINDLTK
jgi:excisionase family DNA binding protein